MPQEEKNTAEKAKKFEGLHACMRPYSMEARGELVSTYMAVLLVGLIFGILGFLLWGERADLSLFRTTWVQTRAFSAYESGGAFMRFFIQWFFHYEWGLSLYSRSLLPCFRRYFAVLFACGAVFVSGTVVPCWRAVLFHSFLYCWLRFCLRYPF